MGQKLNSDLIRVVFGFEEGEKTSQALLYFYFQSPVLEFLDTTKWKGGQFSILLSVTLKSFWFVPSSTNYNISGGCKQHPGADFTSYLFVSSFNLSVHLCYMEYSRHMTGHLKMQSASTYIETLKISFKM